MAVTPTKVPMPGHPPASKPVDDSSEVVSDSTKAEQEAGKKTLKVFEERLKAEQKVGKDLVAKSAKKPSNSRE